MDASSPEFGAELTELRRRAYGPDADIAGDPDALARLAELEVAARRPAPEGTVEAVREADAGIEASHDPDETAERVAGDPDQPDSDAHHDAPTDAASAPPDPAPGSARRAWWRRPSAWLIAAGAIALTVVASGAATLLLAPRGDLALAPVSSDDAERQRLAGQGILEMYGMDRSTLQLYDSYREFHVWSASTTNGNRCILLETDAYGVYGVNCAPEGLDPTFDLYMYPGIPSEMSGDLPIGSVARFVLDGDLVSIWIAEAKAQA